LTKSRHIDDLFPSVFAGRYVLHSRQILRTRIDYLVLVHDWGDVDRDLMSHGGQKEHSPYYDHHSYVCENVVVKRRLRLDDLDVYLDS
jgi:hypothetical protein